MILDLVKQMDFLNKSTDYFNAFPQWTELHSKALREISKTKVSEDVIKNVFLSSYFVPELVGFDLITKNKTTELTKRLYLMKMHKQCTLK